MLHFSSFARRLFRPISFGLVSLLFTVTRLWALNPAPYTEGVSFSFRIDGTGDGMMRIFDETGTPTLWLTGTGTTVESTSTTAWLRPGKAYTVNFQGDAVFDYLMSFIAPNGYSIYVNGQPLDLIARTTGIGATSYDFTLELRPSSGGARGDAGNFSGIDLGKSVTWEVGLGGLRSGQSAGQILFKELDLVTNAPDSRARLYYVAPANIGQITEVHDTSSPFALRQIGVPQTVVDLVDDTTYGGYRIKFYATSQATFSSGSYTFTGSPWKTIRVESPGTNQLKITETEGTVSRVSQLTLTSGTIASGAYTWTLQEGDGTTVLRTTTHTSTVPSSGLRNEVVLVQTGGSSGLSAAKTTYHFTTLAWGEEVTQIVADPDNDALTTTYDYYTTSTDYGNFRKIKSITNPTGAWVSYLYYDDWNRRGRLAIETRPYLDSHSTVQAASGAVDDSVTHDYVADFTGRYRIESSREHRTTNIVGGLTQTSPTINQTQDGQLYTSYQTDAYADSSLYQRSVSWVIDGGNGSNNPDYYGLPYTVKRPDQSQDSFTHHLGSYNYSTKAFTYPGDLSHFRTTVFHGTTNSGGADSYTAFDSLTVAQIYLVANRSTKDVTIRNPAGDIVRTETHVYTGSGSFTLLSYEDFTYDAAGRLTSRVASNGATTSNTYTNGQLTSQVGVDGTETTFTYDELGRVHTSTKKGVASYSGYAAQGDIVTTVTYDGANHVKTSVVSGGSLSVTTTADYDLAGRVTQTVAPGSYTTNIGYSSGGKIVTTTLPDGETRVTETYLDGQLKSVSGTAVVGEGYTYGMQTDGRRGRQSIFGSNTSAWINDYWDWLGRPSEQHKPIWGGGSAARVWYYNSAGQLSRFDQPGLASTLYVYDNFGRLYRQGLDLNANGTLDLASGDRISESSVRIENYGSLWGSVTRNYVYATASSATATFTGSVFQRMNLSSGTLAEQATNDIYGNAVQNVTTFDRTHHLVTSTSTSPDPSAVVHQVSYNGLSVETSDTAGTTTGYGYDALGRNNTVIDPRTGTTTTAFVSGTNQIYTVTDPASVVQATYTYDSAGRVATVTNARSKVCRYSYTARGEKYHVWGDTDYPVEYGYNASGQQTTMKTYRGGSGWTGTTWPSSPGTADTTTWAYDAATNLLASKTDAAGKAVTFSYTNAGQLETRTWARILSGTTHVTTTYGYDGNTGELLTVDYNDSTADLTYTYNRLGQVSTVNDYTGSRTFTYNLSGSLELQHEDLPSYLGSRRITYLADTSGVFGRPIGLQLGTSSSPSADQSVTYGYDSPCRLNAVSGLGQSFAYSYTTNSQLIETVSNSSAGYTDTRHYNATHNWTDSRTTTLGSTTKADFAYTPDNLGRVTLVTKTGELFNRYGNGTQGLDTHYDYDEESQVKSEVTKLGTTTTVLTGRDDAHNYDSVGNRSSVTHNGNTANYSPNALNQYDQRDVPGVFDVAGAASSTATVTVNSSSSGVTRHGEYFFKSHPLTNTSAPVSTTLAISDGSTTTNLPAFVAGTPEVFTYDDDGNLKSDGRWLYYYDAENRPYWIQTTSAAVAAGYPNYGFLFYYDYLGRRILKQSYHWNGTAHVLDKDDRFIYNGWNPMVEIDGSTGNIRKSFLWGLDLSGSGQGAGGVGGLLMVQEGGNSYLPIYDAMGSVHGLIKASDGSLAAAYEYDAFGQTLRESGPYAASNPFRYSTKYTDIETGLIYYGHRYYSPSLGRFINRDPIEEAGGVNIYGFCANNGVNRFDRLGMDPWTIDEYTPWGTVIVVDTDENTSTQFHLNQGYDRAHGIRNPQEDGGDTIGNGGAMFTTTFADPNQDVTAYLYEQDLTFARMDAISAAARAIAADSSRNASGAKVTVGPFLSPATGKSVGPTPGVGGSSLGKVLRQIPLFGGMLGGIGDIVGGVGNAALGLVSFGDSGTFGRGMGQIGYGAGETADILGRDMAATAVGLAGTTYTTARDVANVATLGQFPALGNSPPTGGSRVATGAVGALTRTLLDAVIPEYGMFGGPNWGIDSVGRRQDLIINQGDVASYGHDLNLNEIQWLKTNYTTNPTSQWVGPVGTAYALLGTVPFGIKGLLDKEH